MMAEIIAEPRRQDPAGADFLLLPPTQQAHAYANVDRMFATRVIHRGQHVMPLPRGAEIAPRYEAEGAVQEVSDYVRRANISGLLVIKDGAIRLERYALGLSEERRWSSMSMVKSLTSTLVGVAIKQGAIRSLDDMVSGYIPELRGSAYDGVSIRHLITMSSGVAWAEVYTDRDSDVNRYSKSLGEKVPGGVLALMRELKPLYAPGSQFNYNTGDTYVLGALVSAATGKRLADFMSESVWARLGMEFDAFYTLESEGGQEIGGSRAGMALRDFGRFGQFVLQEGLIPSTGEHMLPQGWVDAAETSYFPLNPAENSYGASGYGYSWWLAPEGAMVAVGFAGQSLYINRAEKLVVVTLSCQPQPPFAAVLNYDFKTERKAFHAAVIAALKG